jgi:hypothetical protein
MYDKKTKICLGSEQYDANRVASIGYKFFEKRKNAKKERKMRKTNFTNFK